MAVNQEVQWGVRADGQPGDGEKIRTGDLNAMQRLLSARMSDAVVPIPESYAGRTYGLTVLDVDSTQAVRSIGHGGYPKASATTRTLTNSAGVIAQRVVATPTGLVPSVLHYPLAADELATQFDAGEAVNLRIDSVFIKLEEIGANDAGTLLTGQAIHQKAATSPYETTSQDYYSRLQVRITKSVVKGTPHATTPVAPSVPTGYARYADVYIPATWNTVVDPLNIRDARYPSRLVWRRYGAKHWNSGTWTVNTDLQLASAAAANIARLEFDKGESPHLSRLLGLGINIKTGAAGVELRLMRFNMEPPFSSAVPVRETDLSTLEATMTVGAVDSGYPFAVEGHAGILWMNGYSAGPAMYDVAPLTATSPGPHGIMGLKLTAASNADKVLSVWTITAEP